MTKRYHRSVSQMGGYTECSERFRLTRMVKPRLVSRPASWFASGHAQHEAIDVFEKSERRTDPVSDYYDLYDAEIEKLTAEQPNLDLWMKPPRSTTTADISNRRKGGAKGIENYLTYCEEPWEIWRFPDGTQALEVSYDITLGDVPLKGAVDRLVWWPKDNRVVIEDLKGGNRVKKYFQLGDYALVMNLLHHDILPEPITFGRYFYLKDGGVSEWQNLSWRYNEAYRTEAYKKLDEGIQNSIFLPNPGDHCTLCPVSSWCREMGTLKEHERLQ